MTTVLLLGGLLAVGGAAFLLGLAVLPAGPSRVPLSRIDPTAVAPSTPLAGATAVAGAAVDRALRSRGWAGAAAVALDAAGMTLALSEFVLLVGVVGLLAGVLGFLVGGVLVGLLGVLVVVLGARSLVRLRIRRRQAAFADQLSDALQLMASSLRAGHSILRALDSVATEAAAPTSEEFARIVNETRVGRDLGSALDEVAARMGSDDFSWIAQAIAIQREVGGNLAEVLDQVGHTIRERSAIRRQVKALSAEGKLSAIVLMALPFVVIGFISMANPGYMARFTEGVVGYGMIAVASVLLLVGAFWLKKTVAIRF